MAHYSTISRTSGQMAEFVGFFEVDQSKVSELDSQLGLNRYQQADESNDRFGEPAPNDPITVAELRPRAHDMLTPNRDRDYKSPICYPVGRMEGIAILAMRVSQSRHYATHVLQSKNQIWQMGVFCVLSGTRAPGHSARG